MTSQNMISVAAATATSTEPVRDIYIYELAIRDREELSVILDNEDAWRILAKEHMGYQDFDIHTIERQLQMGKSPSDQLLHMWGELNHTITELFVLLSRMQQYTAMEKIKNYVKPRFHKWIPERPEITNLLRNQTKSTNEVPANTTNNSASDENNESLEGAANNNNNDTDINKYASTIPQINYQELVDATNNWNKDYILGKGGFGTVYQGMWKFTQVAIKRIDQVKAGTTETMQIQQSVNELRYLNSCRHDNILPIYGYSIGGGGDPCLVYQYMPGGSLEQRLFNIPDPLQRLTWTDRINISRGTARGLQYLHTLKEKPLIHGDIKPGNILLDACKQPKIGDFGLAREGPNSLNSEMEVSRIYGTKPYLPIEFIKYRKLSTKVDTFSFGIVLFELISGMRAYDGTRSTKFLIKIIEEAIQKDKCLEDLIDNTIPMTQDGINLVKILFKIARNCTLDKAEQRPEMVMVLWHLYPK